MWVMLRLVLVCGILFLMVGVGGCMCCAQMVRLNMTSLGDRTIVLLEFVCWLCCAFRRDFFGHPSHLDTPSTQL